jgi:hypothetical protein
MAQQKPFYWLWLSTAFPGAWTITETVSGAFGLAALYLAKRRPDWGPELSDLGWQIPLGVFGLIFLVRLFLAPLEIYRDQRADIRSREEALRALRATLESRRKNHRLADLLAKKDEWAVHNLWAKRPKDEDGFFDWLHSRRKWEQEVEAILDEYGCTYLEKKHFGVLGNLAGEYPPEPYHPDSLMNHQLVMLALTRKRLQDIIDTYSSKPLAR